ncbi:MAG TPA: carboxyl transferase domain-containing protein, partial [Candidatus Binatia bacterium]
MAATGKGDSGKRLAEMERGVLEGDPKAVEKQHGEGRLTARERLHILLDGGTFIEEFMLAETQVTDFGMAEKRRPSDGVVTGYGKIEGRPVYVFAQDRTVLAGTVGSAHAEKIAYVIERARSLGVPLIGLYDSAGARIQEGLSVTTAIGKIFFENSITSGVVPQISAVMGPCIGVASYSPALTDFVVMVQGSSQMFITGPPVIKEVLGEEVTMEELGGAKVHSEVSGVADLTAKTDGDCLSLLRKLVGFLPSNCRSLPPSLGPHPDAARPVEGLDKIVPEEMRRAYNVLQVLKALVDGGDFLELKGKFARNLVIGLGRLDGHPVG